MKRKEEIKITREQFRETAFKLIANPFDEGEKADEDLKVAFFLTGMLVASKLEDRLFGKEK